MFWFILIGSLYLTILVLVAAFRPKAAPTRRVALVIGNTAYNSPRLKRLEKAVKDADAVAKALTRLGFKVVPRFDLSKSEMEGAFKAFKDTSKKLSMVLNLFFWSWHGVKRGELSRPN